MQPNLSFSLTLLLVHLSWLCSEVYVACTPSCKGRRLEKPLLPGTLNNKALLFTNVQLFVFNFLCDQFYQSKAFTRDDKCKIKEESAFTVKKKSSKFNKIILKISVQPISLEIHKKVILHSQEMQIKVIEVEISLNPRTRLPKHSQKVWMYFRRLVHWFRYNIPYDFWKRNSE